MTDTLLRREPLAGPLLNRTYAGHYLLTHDSGKTLVERIADSISTGYGFIPLIGAGLSAPSGVPLVRDMTPYLQKCIGMSLGIGQRRPWNPRADQWPPFILKSDTNDKDDWFNLIQQKIKEYSTKQYSDLPVLQEALGAIAEWRTSLQFLSRLTHVSETRDFEHAIRFMLDVPKQEVVDAGLRAILQGKQPTLAHKMLASLGGLMRLDVLLTTNFDELIEQAFADARNPVTVFDVHLGDSIPAYSAVSTQRSLIKMHGNRYSLRADYSLDSTPTENDIHSFLEYLAGREFEPSPDREVALPPCRNHLLVVGVAGTERRTLTFIRRAWNVFKSAFKVYWIAHRDQNVKDALNLFKDAPGGNEGGFIIRHTNPGLLFLQVFQHLRLTIPNNGVIFPSTPRLSLPPLATRSAKFENSISDKNRVHKDEVTRNVEKRLRFLLADDKPNCPRLILLTSPRGIEGVTSIGATLFETFETEANCLWLDLNDIRSADDLFEQLIDTMYYRLGSETWLPVYVANDAPTQAAEVRRLATLSSQPWVIFLNARETPGCNRHDFRDVDRQEYPNNWIDLSALDGPATMLSPRVQRSATLTTRSQHNDGKATLEALTALLNELFPSESTRPIVVGVLLLRGIEEIRHTNGSAPEPGRDSKDTKDKTNLSRVVEETGASTRQAGDDKTKTEKRQPDDALYSPLCCSLLADGSVQQGAVFSFRPPAASSGKGRKDQSEIAKDCEQWIKNKPKEATKRAAFLQRLILMQRTRFESSVWYHSESRNKKGRIEHSNISVGDKDRKSYDKWLDELETMGLVRRKLGGFIWLHAERRNTLRDCWNQIAGSLKDFEQGHWELAQWYYRLMQSSLTPQSLLESIYHACESAIALKNGGQRDYAQLAHRRLRWACNILRQHYFLIQTIGYSRGTCRSLKYIRDERCAPFRAEIEKIVTSTEETKRLADSILRLEVQCTEVMRCVAREVGELKRAYERHCEVRNYFVFRQSNVPKHIAQTFDIRHKFASIIASRRFLFNGIVEWIRWWKWNGMLGMASRSYLEAKSALMTAIKCAASTGSKTARAHLGVRGRELVTRADKADRLVCDFVERQGDNSPSRQDGFCGMTCKDADVMRMRIEILKALEEYFACRLLELSVERRQASLPQSQLASGKWPRPGKLPPALQSAVLATLHHLEGVLESSPEIRDLSWCKYRTLLHLGHMLAWQGEPQSAMRVFADAEAALGNAEGRRFGSDLAIIELYRAEAKLIEAERTTIEGLANCKEFWQFIQTQSTAVVRNPEAGVKALVRLPSQLDQPAEWTLLRSSFQRASASVRDAVRFLDRAETVFARRRRNSAWTTWYFSRRIRASALLIWSSVLDEGSSVPLVGAEYVPEGIPTLPDTYLEDSKRLIRTDAYRLATIIDEYSQCGLALKVHLLLDRAAPRLRARQESMRLELDKALQALSAVARARGEWPSDDSRGEQDAYTYERARSRPTYFAMDERVANYIIALQQECLCRSASLKHTVV
jgi:hypothetical protein